MRLSVCIYLALSTAIVSASPEPRCCGSSPFPASQERQLRLPDGFAMALEPKILFNLWNSDESGRMRLQSRLEFQYTPPAGATGRQARQLMERSSVFSSIRAAFAQFGLDGTACLQRAVCETAAAPRHSDGLLGDLVTLTLSPSREPVTSGASAVQLAPLLEAERRGWEAGTAGCVPYIERCPVSMFNMKSGAQDLARALLDFVNTRPPTEV
ncbi:uncharacterized protein LOC122375760 [Amphibalanus amphitrite]|uniref:uncharacterized protein LOC122374064 n=1 Tax=Amphibalanus amphitrite TaxID=1232801 RepID=UPI001C913A2A|nr:uncharacterized protein LOC122374064 [Amphibalanus amphitrite]XP_043211191.1 uncharacterized protein LOC122375760 [Amphibalanus amphitrite]